MSASVSVPAAPHERHPALLSRDTSVLVVVDMQEPFLAAIHGRDALVANAVLLCRVAGLLGIPIIALTQYASRLGTVAPPVSRAIAAPTDDSEDTAAVTVEAIDKFCFSCADSPSFTEALAATGRTQVVLCGVETHICISQTAHDLSHAGYQVHVCADAVSSRTLEKHKLGMERIRDAGVKPCASEAAVYEWLREAGTPEFKAALRWVK